MTVKTKITKENMFDFPVGTKLVFNYGPMNGQEEGMVVDYGSNEWYDFLIAETENGEEKRVHNISRRGIGVYLLEDYMSPDFWRN